MKPMLVAMNNPISSDPEHALYPLPEGCTGNRIWKMLNLGAEKPIAYTRYIGAFDRVNLCMTPEWSPKLARAAAPGLRERLSAPGQQSIIFGTEVWSILRLGARPEPGSALGLGNGARSYFFFHPSGRSLWYNDPENQRMLGDRLLAMYLEACATSAGT